MPPLKRLKTRMFVSPCRSTLNIIFVPTPLEGGGGGLFTQMGFFVLSILTDRYIRRREL